MSQFPCLKQLIGCAADIGNWEYALKRSNYCKTHLNFLQDICDFAEQEHRVLAFIKPLLWKTSEIKTNSEVSLKYR